MKKNKGNASRRWLISNIFLFVLLVTSFLSRLIFSNHAAAQSYELSRYSQELKGLQRSHERLTLSATELQSMERLLADSGRLELVKVAQVYYLRLPGSVAINK